MTEVGQERRRRPRRRRQRDALGPPDILYHATTEARVDLEYVEIRAQMRRG